ncbi:hypothetical protein QR297_16980 [Pseudomonas shirazica]|uniref:Uncharacterized protein n=1 Tax=Pseudomonas shirazica TaxID=1940636 RepID=A0ABY9SJT9_9PSED|nr:hypothetical protein [Pseudomonas shirazica]WMY83659.1 hypothetical protein QR297_16980 [Pseudomonas shirazica]
MLISDELLDRANDEPLEVGIEVCIKYFESDSQNPYSESETESLEITKFFQYMKQATLLDFKVDFPEIKNGSIDIASTQVFASLLLEELRSIQKYQNGIKLEEELEARFSRKIKNSFGYEFTEGDLKEIQALVNKLRDLITACSELDEDHRRRIARKLEQVQQELHKKISTLDHIYALAIEASIVAGKVGENAKPLIEAAKELMGISWRTHAHTEGLPSGTEAPMLGHDSSPPALK